MYPIFDSINATTLAVSMLVGLILMVFVIITQLTVPEGSLFTKIVVPPCTITLVITLVFFATSLFSLLDETKLSMEQTAYKTTTVSYVVPKSEITEAKAKDYKTLYEDLLNEKDLSN